ncbi:cytochrome c oxidase assembly protein [Aeromicrobium sp. CTD01-1L150]|uniref:cytochrome c oxidase assembly protein n=1 Tax=Aeromicrobium sp. CTD01-1L150 TaxID=3341830 RepID=UPI0035C051D6
MTAAVRTAFATFLLAAAALVMALAVGGGAPQAVPQGIADAGPLVGWGLPLVTLASQAVVVLLVGLLLAVVALMPSSDDGAQGIAVDAVRAASRFAWAWSVLSLVLFWFTVADTFARPLSTFTLPLITELLGTSTGQVLIFQAAVGAMVALVLRWTLSLRTIAVLLGVVLASFVPVAFTGHSAQAGSHDLAAVSLFLHLVGVTLWVGGLAALGWVAWRGSKRFAPALRRFSTLAVWAFVLVGISGTVNASVRLGTVSALFDSGYGTLVLAKIVALVVLGCFGVVQRRRLVRREAGFLPVAVLELLVMAATVGLAVALSRTPTPVGEILVTPAQELLGGPMPPEPAFGDFLWGFTANGVGLAVVGLGVALYVSGLLTLRRRGVAWPVGRSVAWFSGMALIAWATFGGLGVYAHVMFSAHMVSHMMLAMVAPILLVLGAPVTLALRTLPGPRQEGDVSPRTLLTSFLHSRLMRLLTHPVVGPAMFVASLYALYFTPLFGYLMRSHWGHAAMELHFLLVGCLFYYVLIGVDPSPRRIPPIARFALMLITLPFHAFFSIAIMSSDQVLAPDYWDLLDRPYATDLLSDQYLGGSISWALGEVPLVLVMLALLVQWFRSDMRDAKRLDRQADRDDDAALAAYNARLKAMAEHESRRDR